MTRTAALDELLAAVAAELRPVEERIRSHSFVAAVEAGAVSQGTLRAFAAEQREILGSDHRSFLHLADRFPAEPSGPFFRRMAAGELEALALLEPLETALGEGEPHDLGAAAQAYPGAVARLALAGSRLAVAVAFLVNLDAWGDNCVRLGAALRRRYGLDSQSTAFFDFFAPPGPELRGELRAVAAAGLVAGEDPDEARRAAHLLQGAELLFWDALASERA